MGRALYKAGENCGLPRTIFSAEHIHIGAQMPNYMSASVPETFDLDIGNMMGVKHDYNRKSLLPQIYKIAHRATQFLRKFPTYVDLMNTFVVDYVFLSSFSPMFPRQALLLADNLE